MTSVRLHKDVPASRHGQGLERQVFCCRGCARTMFAAASPAIVDASARFRPSAQAFWMQMATAARTVWWTTMGSAAARLVPDKPLSFLVILRGFLINSSDF